MKIVNRCTNCILLDHMDFGSNFPSGDELDNFSIHLWMGTVDQVLSHSKNFYIYLRVKLNGEWLFLICAPYYKWTHTVVFDVRHWEHSDVIRVLEKLAQRLNILVLKKNIPIIRKKYYDQKNPIWPLFRENKVINKHCIEADLWWTGSNAPRIQSKRLSH